MTTPTQPSVSQPLDPGGAQSDTGDRLDRWEAMEPFSSIALAALLLATMWPGTRLFSADGWWRDAIVLVLGLVTLAAVVRALTRSRVAGAVTQLVGALGYVLVRGAGDSLAAGFLPTPSTLTHVVDSFRSAGEYLSTETVPVPAREDLTLLLLCVIAAVVVLSDAGIHVTRSVLLGVVPPLLVFVTLAANRGESEPWWWFVLVAVLFAGLLAAHHTAEISALGGPNSRARRAGRGAALATAAAVTSVAVVAALAVPSVLPERESAHVGRGLVDGVDLATVDFTDSLDLRSDLASGDERPVMLWHTEEADPGPLRVTATSRFEDDRWVPMEGRGAEEVRRDPAAVEGAAPDALPAVSWRDVLEHETTDFEVTANGIERPFVTTPSFPVDLRSPSAVVADPLTDTIWGQEPVNRYTGSSLLPEVPEDLPEDERGLPEDATASLEVPDELQSTLAEVNAEVVPADAAPLDKARAIQAHLRNGDFEYSLSAGEPQEGESMVQTFFRTKEGYCVPFATAMVMMARQEGIPARMAMGLLPGEKTFGEEMGRGSELGDERVVRRADAHAWPELYFEGVGWLRFEPTPSDRAGAAPGYSQPVGSTESPSPSPSESSASPSPSPSPSPSESSASPSPSPSPSSATNEDDAQEEGGRPAWLVPLLLLLGLAALVALGLAYLPWRARRARAAVAEREAGPWSTAWEQLRLDLLDRGVATREVDSVTRQAADVVAARPEAEGAALERLVEGVQQERYAAPVVDTETAEDGPGSSAEAEATRQELVEQLDAHESGAARWRRTLFPASASG
ncbi:Transglutaminase-like superfamily protein [Kytococcus aerolatus]|uniref:Transglutaminase-like superfamily protein n=1 Tax=Kytococcus aerolatus TaxID=592308 RepID=A0A212T575_9MICO|nr:DUF3488 and transglutaminase-like domain-containing protein [Kytococcus aerolatus]SNC60986.1 Transglutaminase-like superfamily protein [Kytococcus aerolatus]